MWTRTFWKAVAERAAKSAAQGALLGFGGSSAAVNAWVLNYVAIAGFAVGAGLLSVLTSIAVAGLTDGNPSIGSAEVLTEPVTVDSDATSETTATDDAQTEEAQGVEGYTEAAE